jgi:hypothetical protein
MTKLRQEVLWGSGQGLLPATLLHSRRPWRSESSYNSLLDARFHEHYGAKKQ